MLFIKIDDFFKEIIIDLVIYQCIFDQIPMLIMEEKYLNIIS